ncbi:trypsin-like serine peptidase [Nannocystis punicea]|uniref:Serine protease n=1 Tax=Nannocystis punicea TaxID=2995304 RepID=A0ABY7GVV6_9BACT|nr:serine protease [Nannocystis poenicansa]WAS91025.1 serine protease [Nannocystis poenicansa]
MQTTTSEDTLERHEVGLSAPAAEPEPAAAGAEVSGRELVRHWFPCPLTVRAGTFELPREPAWRAVVETAKPQLEAALGAVGRLECPELGPLMQCGTAWLVRGDVAVTNRHTILSLLDDLERGRMTLRLDLCAEAGARADLRCPIRRVLYIDPTHDLAFVQVAQLRSPHAGLAVVDSLVADNPVAVIGFPSHAEGGYPQPEYQQCFGDGWFDRDGRGFKRISLGRLVSTTQALLEHDCTTLGGSSGAAIVDLVRGVAIGLNYGEHDGRRTNLGVPGWVVRERLGQLERHG